MQAAISLGSIFEYLGWCFLFGNITGWFLTRSFYLKKIRKNATS